VSFYRRKLPHWQPQDAALFITWRLFGSMPRQDGGAHWLDNPNVAQIVSEAIYFGERELKLYDLIAFVVMPNHVHILIYPAAEMRIITKTLKGFTARRANELLGRTGEPFWQVESFDHWVRSDAELQGLIDYVEENPVRAGFAERRDYWAWSSIARQRAFGGQECPPYQCVK
jgi:REP-associated tyrosine transposase